MQISEYDSKISEAKTKKDNSLKEMESLSKNYIETYTNFLQSEFPRIVEKSVTENPETAQNLGIEKLRELKSELNEVVSKLPEIVRQQFDTDSIWEHRQALPKDFEKESLPAFDLTHNAGKKVSEQWHEIMGHIGQLILKYNLDNPNRDYKSWEVRGKQLPRYKYAISPMSAEAKPLGELLAQYKKKFEEYVSAYTEELKLEKQKQQAMAKDLWNQA